MFTGIIETLGVVKSIIPAESNLHFWIESAFTSELKIDQSVAHNGVCLTVVEINQNQFKVTAVAETISKTNLKNWQVGDLINLERCMPANGRFDGHIVQGHVDTVAVCTHKKDANGSWVFTFQYPVSIAHLLVEKGSVTVNGVSLTCFNIFENTFSVAIIPYTFLHTNFQQINTGSLVNLEFDILGKYVQRMMEKK